MVPAFNPMSCPNLAVPAEVMQHVVQIESGGNPFAIGVVGGRLERQPRNLGEAVATARMLESKGYDYSLGIAQVNRRNLVRYGLDTFPEAFDGCANLAAGAHILASCYGRSGDNWGKAFSCYYSGNFTTGYRDGYVRRIYDAISASAADAAEPITVRPQTRERPGETRATSRQTAKPGTATYRIVMRSVALDATADTLVPGIAQAMASPDEGKAIPVSQPAPETARLETSGSPSDRAFVPRVSGPADASVTAAAAAGASIFSDESFARATAGPPPPSNRGTSDAAFVF